MLNCCLLCYDMIPDHPPSLRSATLNASYLPVLANAESLICDSLHETIIHDMIPSLVPCKMRVN